MGDEAPPAEVPEGQKVHTGQSCCRGLRRLIEDLTYRWDTAEAMRQRSCRFAKETAALRRRSQNSQP